MDEHALTWQPIRRETVFSTRIFDIQEITSRSPENDEKSFYALHSADWVIVVPVIKDAQGNEEFLMVKQWRHGSETLSVEFPGGVIDPGEAPADGARRELLEETGRRAGRLTHVASLSPNPAIMDNTCHVFIAEDLEDTRALSPDDDEYIAIETVPASEVFLLMGQGAYRHGLMLSAMFLYLQKKGRPDEPVQTAK
jgi:8-oxo-dGTP pyrophosphatase MutT (NUDIX family)